MNRQAIASELVAVARELAADDWLRSDQHKTLALRDVLESVNDISNKVFSLSTEAGRESPVGHLRIAIGQAERAIRAAAEADILSARTMRAIFRISEECKGLMAGYSELGEKSDRIGRWANRMLAEISSEARGRGVKL